MPRSTPPPFPTPLNGSAVHPRVAPPSRDAVGGFADDVPVQQEGADLAHGRNGELQIKRPEYGSATAQKRSEIIRISGNTVSVIVPTWNCGPYLQGCLDSLMAQTHPGVEIIVVNDGSTDGSAELLSRYADRVRVIGHEERKGANAARNSGLLAASGDWVTFADADAVYRWNWISAMFEAGRSDHRIGVVYSGCARQFDDGRMELFDSRDWSLPTLWWENYIAMPSLIRRKAIPEVGLDESFDVFDDWQLWLDIFSRGWLGQRVAENLFTACVREEGRTRLYQHNALATALAIARIRRLYARVVGLDHEIGVVIPACGSEDLTIRCLRHLAWFSGLPFEVFYVDNGSPDGTVDAVQVAAERHGVKLQVLQNRTNEGFTAAVNRGLRAAGYRHALVLNNDCFVAPQCIERLWWMLTRQQACAATGPLSNDRGAQSILWPGAIEQAGANPAVRDHVLDPVTAGAMLDQRHRYVEREMLAFFCTLLHRDAVRKFGFLDGRFPSGLAADDEWCHRVRRGGYRCLLALNAFAAHLHSETFRRLSLDYDGLYNNAIKTLHVVSSHPTSLDKDAVLQYPDCPRTRLTINGGMQQD